jgi:hypothetical protein
VFAGQHVPVLLICGLIRLGALALKTVIGIYVLLGNPKEW